MTADAGTALVPSAVAVLQAPRPLTQPDQQRPLLRDDQPRPIPQPAPPRSGGQLPPPSLEWPPSSRRPLDSYALDAMPGAGPLTPLLLDPSVTDVLVNSGLVWIDRGSGLERVEISVGAESDVRRLAQRMAAACGRRLDEACPYVDAAARRHSPARGAAAGGDGRPVPVTANIPPASDDALRSGLVGTAFRRLGPSCSQPS